MARNKRYAGMHNASENERRRKREERAARKDAKRLEQKINQGSPFVHDDSTWAPDPLAG